MSPQLRTLVLGTRGSALARAQSQQVADTITAATGHPVRLEIIRTRGDAVQDRPLAQVGGKGLFTAELEAALRDGSIDFAVHSLKDLPTDDPQGLTLGAVPRRADPRDALVGVPLAELAPGDVVGTGSLRRRTQLLSTAPQVEISGIRGNVDTRLAKRDRGDYRAVVLAMAGMARLGIQRDDIYPLSAEEMVPAVAQGALGVQCRAGDAEVLGILASIDDATTRRCITAERAFLATFGGGCNVPVAAHVVVADDGLLDGVAVGPVGDELRRVSARGDDAVALGQGLAAALQA